MIALTLAEVAALLGAQVHGPLWPDALVTAVVADSRAVAPGALFVALPGERVDGHDFVVRAAEQGAVAALAARPVPGAACLVVPDPLAALGRLARAVVDRGRQAGLRVVGITGSQGKTSTKDLLAQVLETAGPTVAPAGNLNNELGVPLTVLRLTEQTRYLVAEMGARGVGHIAYLCEIAPPDVGVVLNVGHAHVGEFGGRPAIARAKGELVEALGADGVAVLNAGDPLVWPMRTRTRATVLPTAVGAEPPGPGVWATDLEADDLDRYSFTLWSRFRVEAPLSARVALRLTGRHQVENAAAAAAAALAVGLDLPAVAAGLSAAGPRSRWRMEMTERPDGVLVVNDSYNANPDSMAAAVDTLVELGRRRGSRTWAVLGDMLELGELAEAEHARLGRRAAEAGVGRLVAVGAYAEVLAAGFRQARAAGPGSADAGRADVVADRDRATALVRAGLAPGDVVLVKASRGLALDLVADALLTGSRG